MLAVIVLTLSYAALRTAYPFLAVRAPIDADVLIVEGWVPVPALRQAIAEFDRGDYELLLVTGSPIEQGSPFVEFHSYAGLAAATLERLGMPKDKITAVAAGNTTRDRTYAAAVAAKNWLRQHGTESGKLNIVTLGPHARRTRLLFSKAFGEAWQIGIIAADDPSFDPQRWWASSNGVRNVTGEAIAYLHARLFFTPTPAG